MQETEKEVYVGPSVHQAPLQTCSPQFLLHLCYTSFVTPYQGQFLNACNNIVLKNYHAKFHNMSAKERGSGAISSSKDEHTQELGF